MKHLSYIRFMMCFQLNFQYQRSKLLLWRQLLSKLWSVCDISSFLFICHFVSIIFNVLFTFAFPVAPTWGPLGRDVDTITSALSILLDGPSMNALDQTIAPVQLNEKVITYLCLLSQSLILLKYGCAKISLSLM